MYRGLSAHNGFCAGYDVEDCLENPLKGSSYVGCMGQDGATCILLGVSSNTQITSCSRRVMLSEMPCAVPIMPSNVGVYIAKIEGCNFPKSLDFYLTSMLSREAGVMRCLGAGSMRPVSQAKIKKVASTASDGPRPTNTLILSGAYVGFWCIYI